VDYNPVEALEALLLAPTQHLGLPHTATEPEEHYGIKNDCAKLGDEDPEIVAPETSGFMGWAQPTLGREKVS
jgi:hypothetical protein